MIHDQLISITHDSTKIVTSRIDFVLVLEVTIFVDEATEPHCSRLGSDDGCVFSSVHDSVIRDAQTVASNSKNLRDPG